MTVAAIRGSHGLACDLLTHLCEQADIEVTTADADVALLADPTPDDWADAQAAGAPIVLVATHELDRDAVVSAVARGANGVVHPDCDAGQLQHAVAVTAAGGAYFDGRSAAALVGAVRGGVRTTHAHTLTTREQQILRSIEHGDSVKQTARALGIAHKTVENLQGRLFAKLGVRNRAQAIRRAHALGLLADQLPATDPAPESMSR